MYIYVQIFERIEAFIFICIIILFVSKYLQTEWLSGM